MSVTASASVSSHKAVAGAQNHGPGARASTAGANNPLGGNGFLSLLMSMETEPDPGQDEAGMADPGSSLDPSLVILDPVSTPAAPAAGPPAPDLGQKSQLDLTMLLAQAGAGLNSASGLTQPAGLGSAPSRADQPPEEIAKTSGAALTMTQVPSQDAPLGTLQTTARSSANVAITVADAAIPMVDSSSLVETPEPMLSAMAPSPSAQSSVTQNSGHHELPAGRTDPARVMEATARLLKPSTDTVEAHTTADLVRWQTEPVSPTPPTRAKSTELQSRASAGLRELRFAPAAEPSLREPVLTLGAWLNRDADEARADPVRDRPPVKGAALTGGEGTWGQVAARADHGVDTSTAVADPSLQSPESMVADTLSYWVTQGVQNAELTLDGLGTDPVDVSISLRGDEAQIDFRTDQPEIRQVLENAAAPLKDLLAREGLVLSGLSVGSSAQQGAGGQEHRQRPGVRQATIATGVEAVQGETRPRSVQSPSGGVDIFV